MGKADKLLKKLETGKMSVDDAKSLLKKAGCEVRGQKGSHITFYNPSNGELETFSFGHDPLLPYQVKDLRKLLGEK